MKTKAHTKYTLRDGTIVPSVTQVLNETLAWNKQALIAWARKLALAGTDPSKAKEEAADIGTLTHYLIQCHLQKVEPDTSQYSPANLEKAQNCFQAYLEWEEAHVQAVIATERQLVSELYGYGGTADLIAVVDGNIAIVDYKSSNSIYPEYKIQIAAYIHAYEENYLNVLRDAAKCVNRPSAAFVKGHLLQLGKEDGSFVHYALGDLSAEWEVFQHCLAIYKLRRRISEGGKDKCKQPFRSTTHQNNA